jgi:formate dehydrogenase major subunit
LMGVHMITLTIDNKSIEVPENSTVLQAARLAGIEIPTLCDHPELTPYGGCRLCLVEVEGARTLQPSCTLPVNNNMVVHTSSARISEVRKFVLTLLFSERNHFCPFCQVSGGDCELQNAAYKEEMPNWPLSPNFNTFPVDASHRYFVLDNNRCILCRRCVRACGELVGNYTLGVEERGARSLLVADYGVPLGGSTCISCGMCVQICPTGALIDRWSAYKGHDVQEDHAESVCVGCSIGCGITVAVRDNHITSIDGNYEAEINRGVICELGRYTPMADNRQRITSPLVRKDGKLVPATWEEAQKAVVAKLKDAKGKPNGVAALASTRLSAESLHLFKQLFAGTLGSSVVTSIEEGEYTAALSSLAEDTKKPFEAKLDALKAADCVVVLGADLSENHQVAGFIIKRKLNKDASLIVIDPKDNMLDDKAELTLKTKSKDQDVIAALTAAMTNPDDLAALDAAAKKLGGVTGVNLQKAALLLKAASAPVILIGKGFVKAQSAEALKALLAFAKLTKAVVVSTKGGANSLAAAQYKLDQPFKFDGAEVVYLALGDCEPSQRLAQALDKAPFMVVQASYISPLSARADVVLPVGTWAEQEGHYMNMDGRLQEAKKVATTPEKVHTNSMVLTDLVEGLGAKVNDHWKADLYQRAAMVELVK